MTRSVCRGKILFIDDLVTYEAASPATLQKEFEAAVDDYRGGPANLNTAISGNSAQTQTGFGPGKKQEDHEQKTPPQSLSDLQGQGGR